MKFVLIVYFIEAICQTIINSLYNQYENIETFYFCLYLEWPHFGLNCYLELLATLLRQCIYTTLTPISKETSPQGPILTSTLHLGVGGMERHVPECTSSFP